MSLGTQMLPLSSAVKVFMFMSSFMLNISILKSSQVMKRLNWAVKVWPTSLMSEIARPRAWLVQMGMLRVAMRTPILAVRSHSSRSQRKLSPTSSS